MDMLDAHYLLFLTCSIQDSIAAKNLFEGFHLGVWTTGNIPRHVVTNSLDTAKDEHKLFHDA